MDQEFDRQKVKAYTEGLKILKAKNDELLKDIENVAKHAPVEGCERFMKAMYDNLKQNSENISGAIEYWEGELK
ncbi:MAG: hypothetical protein RXN80_02805 [Hydrogenobaculum sp.]|jgi:hypothetical protein